MDYSPIWISVKTAALTIVIVFFIGLAAAKLVAGLKNEKAKMVLDGIFTLPLVLPPTVAGFFLLYYLGSGAPSGLFLLSISESRSHFPGGQPCWRQW